MALGCEGKALLNARIYYGVPESDGEAVIFRLHDLEIALYVATSRSDAPRKVATDVDTISIIGKSALNAFITLLQFGGVHARLNASQDAYGVT